MEELHERLHKLERDWNTMKKESNNKYLFSSLSSSSPSLSPSNITIPHNKLILNHSPRELMFNIQQLEDSPAEERNAGASNDVAAQNILRERGEAIVSGRLKGRRPFQSTGESETESDNVNVTTPRSDVRSPSFRNDSGSKRERSSGGIVIKEVDDNCTLGCTIYYSSSSSSSSCDADVEGDVKEVARLVGQIMEMRVASSIFGVSGTRSSGQTRYSVMLGVFVIIFLLLAMCISWESASHGRGGNVILVPS